MLTPENEDCSHLKLQSTGSILDAIQCREMGRLDLKGSDEGKVQLLNPTSSINWSH